MRTRSLLIALMAFAAPTAAFSPAAMAATKAASCAMQASKQALTGADKTTFMKTCNQGALAPKTGTLGKSATRSAQVVTAPSGADRDTRSKQCAAEAMRRHLDETHAREFRLNCLATAAPVRAAGTSTQPEKPSPAKAGLDTLPKPH